MSFLKSVVNDMLRETAQKTFVEAIHEDTGVPVEKLNEVFHHGMSLMTNPNSDPIIVGKSAVYKFLDEIGEEYVTESEEEWLRSGNHTFEFGFEDVFHDHPLFKGLSNDEFANVLELFRKKYIVIDRMGMEASNDESVVELDPDADMDSEGWTDLSSWNFNIRKLAPVLKRMIQQVKGGIKEKRKLPDASLDCKKCKDEDGRSKGCRACDWSGRINLENKDMQQRRWNAQVTRVIDQAMRRGIEPEELLKQGQKLEKLGHHKGAIYVDAAYKYMKMDPYRKDDKKAAGKSFRYESEED